MTVIWMILGLVAVMALVLTMALAVASKRRDRAWCRCR